MYPSCLVVELGKFGNTMATWLAAGWGMAWAHSSQNRAGSRLAVTRGGDGVTTSQCFPLPCIISSLGCEHACVVTSPRPMCSQALSHVNALGYTPAAP